MQLALAFKQDSTVRLLLKRGGSLPEEVAALPEMQPLINEVENELLQESLNEVAAGKLKEQMTEAETAFEDARQEMLSLCTRTCTASTAPVIHHCEAMFASAKEQVRVKQNQERGLVDQIKVNEKAVTEAEKEVKVQRKNLDGITKSVEELKNGRGKKIEEVARLGKEAAEARKTDATYAEEEAKLATRRDDVTLKVEGLKERLAGATAENDELYSRLEEVQAQLEQWNAEKEAAAELHAQAQALLTSAVPQSHAKGSRPPTRSSA